MAKLKDFLEKPDFGALTTKVNALREKIESRPDREFVIRNVERLQDKFHRPELGAVLDALKENKSYLGAFIQAQLRVTMLWLLLWFGVMGFLLLLNIFIRPEHPHFVLDSYWPFWAVFGLGIGCLMVYVMKRIIQPLIVRKEDYYGDI